MASTLFQSLLGSISFRIGESNLLIRADQLRSHLRLLPASVLSQVLLEPLFIWLFWERADHTHLLWWLTAIYIIHATEILAWWRYRMLLNTVKQCRRWSMTLNLLTLLAALMWGGAMLWFFPQDLAFQALMICIALGLISGAVTLNSAYPPSLIIFVLGVTLPLLARLVLTGDETHWLLAGMLFLYSIGSLSAGSVLSKILWKSLYQRHENDFLVTQLVRHMGIAEAASLDKSRFMAAASHDLRQPLQALVLFSEALQETDSHEETQHLAAQIGKSVEALADMFNELLDISKFDAGMVQAEHRHFMVQEIFDRLHGEFAPLALAKDLAFSMPATALAGYSDSHLLERILRNLISNAIRYTSVGQVSVSCQNIDGMVQFNVSDTGIGISAENLPHIFEEYYQVENQHRDRLKGRGLGLAIVRRMEILLGCRVSVTSEPGRGSLFSFRIPHGDIAQLHMAQPALPGKHDLSGVSVALVEDNLDIRQMVSKLLKEWGCAVHEGEMPHEVLNKMVIDGICPDILISDYRLPSGLTASDAIRQLKVLWNKPIPVIVLSGDMATQTLQEIQSNGALLLHKPIAPARLRSVLYFALQQEYGTSQNTGENAQ